MSEDKWLNDIPIKIGYYLSGFADGEGSFSASLRRRKDHSMGWQVVLTFNVSQKERTVLALFKRYLGCGRLQTRFDGISYYVVSNPISITEKVIPFFKRFDFLSQTKKRNFSIFQQIAELVKEKKHLTPEGLSRIVSLREKLNEGRGRKRKYSLKDYNLSLQKNPQRLYAKPRSVRKEKSG